MLVIGKKSLEKGKSYEEETINGITFIRLRGHFNVSDDGLRR